MSSNNKKVNRQLYAEQRRHQMREEHSAKVKSDVEAKMRPFLQELNFLDPQQVEHCYSKVQDYIKKNAISHEWKEHAHFIFKHYIIGLNQKHDCQLCIPALPITLSREPSVYSFEWFENGQKIRAITQSLLEYWNNTSKSDDFSHDEIIGNILMCAILFAGLNHPLSVEALLQHLNHPRPIRNIQSINIIFLEPASPSYGDIYVDEKSCRKSRNFVPDQLTRLWLIHFNQRGIQHVDRSVDDYLAIVFQKIRQPFNKKILKKLYRYANYYWQQQANVQIDPALVQCLTEKTDTCGLSEPEFKRFYSPSFALKHTFGSKIITEAETDAEQSDQEHQKLSIDVDEVIKIHKDVLRIIRTQQSQHHICASLIEYCETNGALFNPYIQRILLWLISLYQPQSAQIQRLTHLFKIDAVQFQRSFKHYRALADSSIYTYYTRIAEPWLIHTLQYRDEQDDINLTIRKIYQQILSSDVSESPDQHNQRAKSSHQVTAILKRFHQFQKVVYEAGDFSLESFGLQNRPKARIIGPHTYQAFMSVLHGLMESKQFHPQRHQVLSIIYCLAYRTGLRINEILNLRIQDIEGSDSMSIWVQPYGSKQQGNLHRLKTDSAERTVPVYCLLKTQEYKSFHDYVIQQRQLHPSRGFLFHSFNHLTRINHHVVTTQFKLIMNNLFDEHDYSFHSLRHTAANHLALLLNTDYQPWVALMTDYTKEEYLNIRRELLRNDQDQNHWFLIAHLLGHLDPSETFKTYLHLNYVIGGYQLFCVNPLINNGLAKKLMGYQSQLKFLNQVKDHLKFDFQLHSKKLSECLMNQHTAWESNHSKYICNQENHIKIAEHNSFDYFAGTPKSLISVPLFYKCLTLLEIKKDAEQVAAQLSLPVLLVQQWYQNALELKELTSKQQRMRLFDENNALRSSTSLKPSMLNTQEDLNAMQYFFEHLHQKWLLQPDQLVDVFQTFLGRVTASHTGIHFPAEQVQHMETFYAAVHSLFPAKFWHLLTKDAKKRIPSAKYPILANLVKSQHAQFPTSHERILRLQLYSIQYGRALAAFKFCLHLAIIGRPSTLCLSRNKDSD